MAQRFVKHKTKGSIYPWNPNLDMENWEFVEVEPPKVEEKPLPSLFPHRDKPKPEPTPKPKNKGGRPKKYKSV